MRGLDDMPDQPTSDSPAGPEQAREIAAQLIAAAKATTRAYRQVRAKRGMRRRRAQSPALEPRRPDAS